MLCNHTTDGKRRTINGRWRTESGLGGKDNSYGEPLSCCRMSVTTSWKSLDFNFLVTFPPSLDSVPHHPLIVCIFPPVGVVFNAVELVYIYNIIVSFKATAFFLSRTCRCKLSLPKKTVHGYTFYWLYSALLIMYGQLKSLFPDPVL